MLIDPSYEIKSDYPRVVAALKDGSSAATGTYLVWLPFPPSIEARALPEKLKKPSPTGSMPASPCAVPPPRATACTAARFVVNPPGTPKAALEEGCHG